MVVRSRPEALRGVITEPLHSGLGASYRDIAHVVHPLGDTGGIDTIRGAFATATLRILHG